MSKARPLAFKLTPVVMQEVALFLLATAIMVHVVLPVVDLELSRAFEAPLAVYPLLAAKHLLAGLLLAGLLLAGLLLAGPKRRPIRAKLEEFVH